MEWKIGWRNPIRYINQWHSQSDKRKAIFMWCFWVWNNNELNIWIDRGFRFFGIMINCRIYIMRR
jgi:hypothetical protein